MKRMPSFLLSAALIFAVGASEQRMQGATAGNGPQAQPSQQPSPTIAYVVDREISAIEKQVVDAAEAMPEDKCNFSPESLKIPGDEYKGAHVCRAGEAYRLFQLFHLVAAYGR